MFVLNPDRYLVPIFRISPFRTSDVVINHNLPDNDSIDDYFNNRFQGRPFFYTFNGREALNIALSQYNLEPNDIVTIYTTTGNFYISRCVTNEIEKFCKWSRELSAHTRLILVNHEFGVPYEGLTDLKKKGLPIIEDCAHSFFSTDEENNTGQIGDFVIFSLPKMFTLQIGGLLLCNMPISKEIESQLEHPHLRYIKNILSHSIQNKDEIITKRKENHYWLSDKFRSLGLPELFSLKDGIVPGVFMFKALGRNINLSELKKYFYAHGVQCSIFYGEEVFFIPVHQALSKDDLLYFYEVMKSFIKPKLTFIRGI